MLAHNVRLPSGASFWTRYERVVARALAPGSVARFAARLRCGSLDRALIAGADPTGSPQLAARTAILTSPRTRALIADGLERLLHVAAEPPCRARVPVRRGPLRANAAELLELAAWLRGTSPLYARGIAILEQLLTDASGPAYLGAGDELAHRLHEARAALEGSDGAGRARR